MRTFQTKLFARFAKKEHISDASLLEAITRAEVKPDADLGGGLIKQRVARPNEGRSGGYRTIIVFRSRDRSIFVYGFAKRDKANISTLDEKRLRDLAEIYLGFQNLNYSLRFKRANSWR